MTATLLAGIADKNASLFQRVRVPLGDPAAWIEIDGQTIALVRDLEMDRVRTKSRATIVTCPADHAPAEGLDADRETATAQAVANLICARGLSRICADRSLPLIFAWHLRQRGIEVDYDPDLGVSERRIKSEQELDALAKAQAVTERVMRQLCEIIAKCIAAKDATLHLDGSAMTSERVRNMAAIEFLKSGFTMGHGAIVATAPHVADCHHAGEGELRTETPIVIDLFPRDESTRYWGDCTRTVVHGQPSETVIAMHRAVVEAKSAAEKLLTSGNTGDQVHKAAESVLIRHGYPVSRGTITDEPSIQHGTGHGIGLDVHEPILLDHDGGQVHAGEVFTVEPGLYGRLDGGVRVEDMLVVTDDQPRNLNQLQSGLTWG